MASPILKKDIKIGIEQESTEGTYVAPSGTGSYLRPQEDGWSIDPVREELQRTPATGRLGNLPARRGIKSVSGSIPVEMRGEGTEGGAPEYGDLLESALGANRSYGTATTSSTGHTSTVINLSGSDGDNFNVGDIVVVKESGAYEARPISAKTSSSITFPFALDNGAPSDSVVISKVQTYYNASSGHPALSLSFYVGNQVRTTSVGTKITSLAIENWTAGQIPNWNFGYEGLTYGDETDGAAPHTPAYDSDAGPIVALKACLYVGGSSIEYNNFSLNVANTLGFITDACNENGRSASRVVAREITGSLAQFKDDTSTDAFDKVMGGTEFGIFVYGYVPSATAGEITMGTVIALWLPKCQYSGITYGDIDGLHTNELNFRSVIDDSTTNEELYVGFV